MGRSAPQLSAGTLIRESIYVVIEGKAVGDREYRKAQPDPIDRDEPDDTRGNIRHIAVLFAILRDDPDSVRPISADETPEYGRGTEP